MQGPWWDSSWCKVGGTPTTPISVGSSNSPAPAPTPSYDLPVFTSSVGTNVPNTSPAQLKTDYKNGLPLDVLLAIAPAFIILLPGELYSATVIYLDCNQYKLIQSKNQGLF